MGGWRVSCARVCVVAVLAHTVSGLLVESTVDELHADPWTVWVSHSTLAVQYVQIVIMILRLQDLSQSLSRLLITP